MLRLETSFASMTSNTPMPQCRVYEGTEEREDMEEGLPRLTTRVHTQEARVSVSFQGRKKISDSKFHSPSEVYAQTCRMGPAPKFLPGMSGPGNSGAHRGCLR